MTVPRDRSVAVLGAGAVGSYFGAVLARSGVDVTLIGRPANMEAVARDGVRVVRDDAEWTVRVRAATDVRAAADAGIALVTVKSPDTAGVAALLAPHLRSDAWVMSLQNGVDNAARIAAVLPQPVYAAVVYVGAYMDGPGRVRHTGRGDLVIGAPCSLAARSDATTNLRAIAAMFEAAGVACPIAPDIEAALWTKLTLNCAFNAVSALAEARYGEMVAESGIRAVMEDAVREAVAVARADGVGLDADHLVAATWKLAAALAGQYSSTAQDLMRGKPTEIDSLNGYVARRAEALGVPAPVNRMLHALVKLRESQARKSKGSRGNLEPLVS